MVQCHARQWSYVRSYQLSCLCFVLTGSLRPQVPKSAEAETEPTEAQDMAWEGDGFTQATAVLEESTQATMVPDDGQAASSPARQDVGQEAGPSTQCSSPKSSSPVFSRRKRRAHIVDSDNEDGDD